MAVFGSELIVGLRRRSANADSAVKMTSSVAAARLLLGVSSKAKHHSRLAFGGARPGRRETVNQCFETEGRGVLES
jgi:hypothetical protein